MQKFLNLKMYSVYIYMYIQIYIGFLYNILKEKMMLRGTTTPGNYIIKLQCYLDTLLLSL